MLISSKIYSILRIVIFSLLFILTLIPLLIPNKATKEVVNNKEKFNSELHKYNTVDNCSKYIDSICHCSVKEVSLDTIAYANSASDFFKERFYHGLSNYSISENWIAYFAGKCLWSHLSAIVNPDDILKYSDGLCSQQNIAFTEVLKNKGITSRSVGLGTKEGPGHFLTEIWYNGTWHLYDIDIEPNWEILQFNHLSMDSLIKNKELIYALYDNKLEKSHLDTIIKTIKYGSPNEFPAKKMLLFHRITKILTYLLPLVFLIMIIITLNKKEIPTKILKKVPIRFKKQKTKQFEH